MKKGIRIKGGVGYKNGQWYAIIDVWDNHLCKGEPEGFTHPKAFDSQLDALAHYHKVVQPIISAIMAQYDDMDIVHKKIDELFLA